MEQAIIEVKNLKKHFILKKGIFRGSSRILRAVDDVSFSVKKGEIFGLVGMSGCGKTTCARLLVKLLEPTSGGIYFWGNSVKDDWNRRLKEFRRRVQMVFQDPYESLNPRINVFGTVSEPLVVQGAVDRSRRKGMVLQALEKVGLSPAEKLIYRYPHELSGGQRQRVAIARALVVGPDFIVADEPVSMLDASIQAGVMNLLLDLRNNYGLTFIFITHDLAAARYLTDRVAIMCLGKILETAPTEEMMSRPLHPYTQLLLSAVPDIRAEKKAKAAEMAGELSSPVGLPSGCRFYPLCSNREEICRRTEPPLKEVEQGHFVACHLCK